MDSSVIPLARQHSLVDQERLENLARLSEYAINSNVPGDFVECGVNHGGSALVLGHAIKNTPRKLWLYDTFDKMPNPKPIDGPSAAAATACAGGVPVGGVSEVTGLLDSIKFPKDRYVIRKGLFQETFAGGYPRKIALIHIDADWYDSVLYCLTNMYPLVSPGGVILLDDFGYFEGCRLAFYDFCIQTKERPLLERCSYTQAWWKKGKEHNQEQAR